MQVLMMTNQAVPLNRASDYSRNTDIPIAGGDLIVQTCLESHIPSQDIVELLLDGTVTSGNLRETHNWNSNTSSSRLKENKWAGRQVRINKAKRKWFGWASETDDNDDNVFCLH